MVADHRFYVDRRISPKQQTDDYLYYEPGGPEDEFFDRGHLTRRDDVAWGTAREAKVGLIFRNDQINDQYPQIY